MSGEVFDPNQSMAQALLGDQGSSPGLSNIPPSSPQDPPTAIPFTHGETAGSSGPSFSQPQAATPSAADIYSGLYVDQSNPFGAQTARDYANALAMNYANPGSMQQDGTLANAAPMYANNNNIRYGAPSFAGSVGGETGGGGAPHPSGFSIGGRDPLAQQMAANPLFDPVRNLNTLPRNLRDTLSPGLLPYGHTAWQQFPATRRFAPPNPHWFEENGQAVNINSAAIGHDQWGYRFPTGQPGVATT